MNYITGASGFLGNKLKEKLGDGLVAIPHKDIPTFKLEPFDHFYFCSGYGNLAHHTDDDAILRANVTDLVCMIEQAAKLGFKSFTYISTSSVKLPIQTMYSRSKKAAEEILLAFMEKYNLNIQIIRPFSITGVGEQKEHLIPKLIDSCLNGTEVEFVSTPRHDFIDVDDVVEGILNLSFNHARGIFELGTGRQYSNQQVLKLVEEATGKTATIKPVEKMRPYDTDVWVSSNYKSRAWGWLPDKPLFQSINEMVGKELHVTR